MTTASSQLPIEPDRAVQILRAHNIERAKHGLAPLEWDWSLAQAAQRWASQCRWMHWKESESAIGSAAFRATQPPNKGGRWSLGENLAMTAAQPKSARTPVSAGGWIDERRDWTCGAAIQAANECKPGKMCGHLTQMLWADTKRVGCAIQECPNGFPELGRSQNAEYLVCEYSPPGNFVGQAPFPATQCAIRSVDTKSVPALVPPFQGSGSGASGGTGTSGTGTNGNGSNRGGGGNTTIPFVPTVPIVPPLPTGTTGNTGTPSNGLPPSEIPRPTNTVPLQPFPNSSPTTPVPPAGDSNVVLVTAPDGTEFFVPAALQADVEQLTPAQLQALANRVRTLQPAEQPIVVASFLQELNETGEGADTTENGENSSSSSSSNNSNFWNWLGIALSVLVGAILLSLLVYLVVLLSRHSKSSRSSSSSSGSSSSSMSEKAPFV